MVAIRDLANDKRDITVQFETEEIHVSYRPSIITTKFVETKDTVDQVAAGVIEWDIVDDNNVPIALDVETLRDVPLAILRRVWWDGVIADNRERVGLPEAPGPSAAG